MSLFIQVNDDGSMVDVCFNKAQKHLNKSNIGLQKLLKFYDLMAQPISMFQQQFCF